MKDYLRRLLLWLLGEVVSDRVVEELVRSVLGRLRDAAARTETGIDDAVLDAVERSLLDPEVLVVIRRWLEDQITGRG